MVAKSYINMYDGIQAEQLREIDSFIRFLERSTGVLRKKDTITVLHQAQLICGRVSKEVQQYIAKRFNVSVEEIEETVNFYEYFTTDSQSERILSPC
ncbi:MAG: hypothetical protein GX640_10735 [Fibrobacter sp.]|nr:hypothetical protein [Fibrobacter sp.]